MASLLIRCLRFAGRGVLWLLALPLVYCAIALYSALLPARGDDLAASPVSTQPVYVCADPIHTDFAFPISDVRRGGLTALAPALPEGLSEDTFVLAGWGDYDFFTEVTSFGELRPGVAARALLGLNPSAVRVVAVSPDFVETECKVLRVSEAGRAALVDHVRTSLQPNAKLFPPGRFQDAYLAAKGRYSPLHTCNQWTAEALGEAGLPHARFAPFSFSVMWPLERDDAEAATP